MSGLQSAIRDSVLAGFDDQIAFLKDLVACPSTRGDEASAQDAMEAAFAARGLSVERWELDAQALSQLSGFSPVSVDYSGMSNVVGTHQPKQQRGRSLILNGHIDVVPAGPKEFWTSSPYQPRLEGDWLYGRGAGDMKAGLTANLFALDALRRMGFEPAARIHLQSVVEEECTGNGALACMARGYTADAALIPEPFDQHLVRANVGTLWFRLKFHGIPVHALDTGSGSNAIEAASHMIGHLRRLEKDWNSRKGRHRHFEDHPHPINLNIGKIEGGDWASSVPAWCHLDCRIAIYPGDAARDAAAEIENFIRNAANDDPRLAGLSPDIEWNGFFAEGYVLEEGSQAEAVLAHAHETVTEKALRSVTMPCYLDARVFAVHQKIPCLVYGPKAESIHGYDERVSLSSLRSVTETIALFIAQWCGLNELTKGASRT
ncbi:ArgE/DapE family deacylase [Qingshengfaniella alkalisoli]|uniref:ArgE/DapE family deacylase n=1 Tax=Qingshengfaniella alkalisoli TaxID=2599296 RepID=A0A5B8IC03_9RHOB|nr:ArgE/DapE family deacylase [Qingshengfaniella alkalisoli]QDY71056.1 ArgE/DapE family deacylase [Qingshengfaniella alkalisoli]